MSTSYLFLDGANWDDTVDIPTREIVQSPALAIIKLAINASNLVCQLILCALLSSTSSNVGYCSAICHRISESQPTLPAELLVQVFEQFAIPQARSGFYLEKGVLKTLVSMTLLNQTFNGLVTPILYRRIRLVTSSAIRSLHMTLSYPPRGTYLASLVKHFLAYDPTNEGASYIPAIISLIRDSVEYVHIDRWPKGSSGLELRDSLASIRSLRQFSVNGREKGGRSPTPHFSDLLALESVVLDDSNVLQVVQKLLSDASIGVEPVVGPNLSIYCVAYGTMPPWWVCQTMEEVLQKFIATGRDLPPFKIIMFFRETSTVPTSMWARLNLHRWYCLPVPHSVGKFGTLEFDQWMCRSVEDGSLWDMDLIPMSEWATWVKTKFPPEEDDAQGPSSI